MLVDVVKPLMRVGALSIPFLKTDDGTNTITITVKIIVAANIRNVLSFSFNVFLSVLFLRFSDLRFITFDGKNGEKEKYNFKIT
jgi:hypothetical protein